MTVFLLLVFTLCSSTCAWIVITRADLDQRQSSVAYFNNQYLVIYSDSRDITPVSGTSIYACRVTRHGDVLDTSGFLVSGGADDRLMPKVCAGISGWLATWHRGC